MKNTFHSAKAATKPTNVLKKLRMYKLLCWVLPFWSVLLGGLTISELMEPEFAGYAWCIYLKLALTITMISLSIFELYRCTHADGAYRCKACGQIHTPDAEALAEMLIDPMKYSHLHCTACDKRTRHYKLRSEENA